MNCNICKDTGMVRMKCLNRGTCEYTIHTVVCPLCEGKKLIPADKVVSVETLNQIVE